jgi:hypothetical protein
MEKPSFNRDAHATFECTFWGLACQAQQVVAPCSYQWKSRPVKGIKAKLRVLNNDCFNLKKADSGH